jgi:transcriptional regulator with XRE-family HTH domain
MANVLLLETADEIADAEAKKVFRDNVVMMLAECDAAGLSTPRLAKRMGVERQNIYNWRDGTEPSLTNLVRLRRAWDLDFTEPIEEGSFSRILTTSEMGL